ncbi:MAG: signal recognition particle-docking protein FtsY [Marinobacter sp.]|nr:signal recognition particle-docking protein FtsY [Marinobacter sp.]
MNPEWISLAVLALLVLVFVLDVASRRRSLPRPKPVPQRKAEVEAAPESIPVTPAPVAEEPAEATPAEAVAAPVEAAPVVSVLQRIKAGLGKTRSSLTAGLADLFAVGKSVDDDLLEEVETTLLMADVGVTATTEIIEALTEKLSRKELKDGAALKAALKQELRNLLGSSREPLKLEAEGKPFVILVVGVNGVGKTTTIGKLTKRFQQDGKSVMLAAGDTFRAAAVEQLQVWGERNQVPVVAQHTGADSASVIFDAVQSAQSKGIDVVIADTAGRLQNKDNLMSELEKVVRVMKKLDPQAPHEVLLVLDAGTGQNALSQAQVFQQAVGVTGITLTKLDGTAKGGIVFAIGRQLQLPIRFIGVGEQVDDLRPFDAETFVDALFDE